MSKFENNVDSDASAENSVSNFRCIEKMHKIKVNIKRNLGPPSIE